MFRTQRGSSSVSPTTGGSQHSQRHLSILHYSIDLSLWQAVVSEGGDDRARTPEDQRGRLCIAIDIVRTLLEAQRYCVAPLGLTLL